MNAAYAHPVGTLRLDPPSVAFVPQGLSLAALVQAQPVARNATQVKNRMPIAPDVWNAQLGSNPRLAIGAMGVQATKSLMLISRAVGHVRSTK